MPHSPFGGHHGDGGGGGDLGDVASGMIRVRMGDGSFQDLRYDDPALDAALQGGATPLDPITGEDMAWREPFGRGEGYTYGEMNLPGNVIAGGNWEQGQRDRWQDIAAGYPGGGGDSGDWMDMGDGTQLNTRTGETRQGGPTGGLGTGGGGGGDSGDWMDMGDGTQLNTRTGETRQGGPTGGLGTGGGGGGQGGGTGGGGDGGGGGDLGDVASGMIRVRMGDGSFQDLRYDDPALDAALQGGATPLDPITGEDMAWREPFGRGEGYSYGEMNLPGNIIAGGNWEQGQLDRWQDIAFEGTLMAGYPEKFKWDPSKITEDAGYQFALGEGEKGIQRGASANLNLLSGKTLKDMERFRAGLNNQYANTYYDRAVKDFERDYNIFEQSQGKRFARLFSLAGLGPPPAVGQLNTAGSNFGVNAGNTMIQGGKTQADLETQTANARASGYASRANIWGAYDPWQTGQDLQYLNYFRNQ